MASHDYNIRVSDGARLITSASLDNVDISNWSRKLNFRRFRDQEIRQEGWVLFKPNASGSDSQSVYDGTEVVQRLAELVRPNGERVVVGASQTKIKKFNPSTFAWDVIGSGFSSIGMRWQTDTMNGYLILNNAVDLPVTYRVEDAAVTPIYELRQVGIASVGRIRQYNGFLLVADVVEIKGDQLDTYMNGYANYTATSTVAKAADFTVVFATDHQKQFNVTTGIGSVAATLPAMTLSSQPFYFWVKKIDNTSGDVVIWPSPSVPAIVAIVEGVNSLALIWWTGTQWGSVVFPGGVIPASTAYGVVPASLGTVTASSTPPITNHIPYEVANSEFGDPTKWAPNFGAFMAAAGTTIYLPFVPNTWVAGKTRVGVQNAGPSGGILGGQSAYPDGVLVTSIGSFSAANMGVPITIEVTTDAALTYPRAVSVLRWTDISSFVARYLLQDDGSKINGMERLGELVVIYRTTGIYLGRYTGSAGDPFVWTPRYPTSNESLNIPLWGDAIATVNGDYHLYPGIGNRFYQFDGVSWPTVHQICDDAKELFFAGVLESDSCFVVGNPLTKQLWFCTPRLTFCFDFEFNTVSELNAVIGGACICRRPAGTDRWFILAIGKNVFTYGLVDGAIPINTWLRPEYSASWIVESASEANYWIGIAWSPSLAIFAAVAQQGTNRVMTSPDGITWTARAAAEQNNWVSIAWSPALGLFAAVARNGTNRVMTSPDGITWTARAASEANQWNSIAWSPALALFAAVSLDGANQVMTSPDGITWTARAASEANFWNAITWSPALAIFAAVSSNGANRIMTSGDGITWGAKAAPEANLWTGITWSPSLGLFAAVSVDGAHRVMTSADGSTWTARTAAEANSWYGITWSPDLGLFAAVAYNGAHRVMVSSDGITWNTQTASEANSWYGIAWSPALGIFAAVAGDGTNRVMISYGFVATAPTAILKSGLGNGGDPGDEKALASYTVIQSSESPDTQMQIQLYGAWNPSAALQSLLVPPVDLPDPQGANWFTTAFEYIYFGDQITVTDTHDVDCRISSRIFELDRIGRGRGITRKV